MYIAGSSFYLTNKPFDTDEAMKSFVFQSINDITYLFKAISHPKRLEILSLMFNKKFDFKTLIEEINLPKSALSNHLSALQEKI